MKIRNLFLIISLISFFAQPIQQTQGTTQPTSPAISSSKQVSRTYFKVNFIGTIAVQGDALWATTDASVVRWNTSDGSYVKYTSDESLPSNNIVPGIAKDAAGNLWFGTDKGVSKFDGSHWTTYTAADGLASNRITAIASDAGGNLWFGTDKGVSKFDGANWSTYTTADGLAGNLIAGITSDSAGDVWLVNDNDGVSKFNGTNWTTYTSANGLASNGIIALASDPAGNIWVSYAENCGKYFCDDYGVSKFDGTNWTTYTSADGLASNLVFAIASDPAGNVWFGTPGNGVSKFDGTNWTTYTSADGLASDVIYFIKSDPGGNLWFGVGDKVSKFDGTHWTTYATNGPASNHINAITSDPAGNLWLGTDNGVSRFDGTNWTTYTTADGMVDNNIRTITSDTAGNIWVGSWYGNGASMFNGTTWKTYTSADGLACDDIQALASDPTGNVWFSTCEGVEKFDGSHWTTYPSVGLSDYAVTAIASDPAGNMWFGTLYSDVGVSKFDGTNWITYTTADGLAGNIVASITSDLLGNLWFGTYGDGVSKFDGTSWTTYTTADGLADNYIRGLAVDSANNVWAGTSFYDNYGNFIGKGVSKFDGTHWNTYTTGDSLTGDSINAIASDPSGNVWVGTDGGVSEFYTIHLNSNFASGAPGSFFNLSGDPFPANQTIPVAVNGSPLGDIPVSSNGVFTFTLSTTHASEGYYFIKVGDHTAVQLRLTLDSQQPTQGKEGNYTTFDIPPGIAFTKEFYLPFLN